MFKKLKTWLLLVLGVCVLAGCGSETDEVFVTETAEIEDVRESLSDTIDFPDQMTVHFIDVGQADATLITCGDSVILIDAGDNSQGTYLQNYLEKQGIDGIDLFIVTHMHADHAGGADVIITKFDVDTLWLADYSTGTATERDVYEAAEYKNLKYSTPSAGDVFYVGDMEVDVIAPAYDGYDDPNNSSIGVIVRYGDTSFLFTGDCEEEAETAILETGIDLDVDVYQVGHHGSYTSSSEPFLKAMTPDYAVISCGEGNSYGHPHAQTLNSLMAMGVEVFRTDEEGTIIATSDGKTITWDCAPSETWQTGERTGSSEADDEEDEVLQAESVEFTGYVGNANSMKFHYADCDSVSQMAEYNRVDLSDHSREEIIEMGYTPCGICKP